MTTFCATLSHLQIWRTNPEASITNFSLQFYRGTFYDTFSLHGRQLKLQGRCFFKDTRRWAFSNWVVSEWNSLPSSVVDNLDVDSFKKGLDNLHELLCFLVFRFVENCKRLSLAFALNYYYYYYKNCILEAYKKSKQKVIERRHNLLSTL